ncbi:hypothetical protein [Salipiger thiooxidans]|nr:hypothetical protein [Salipiger thiooxidans]
MATNSYTTHRDVTSDGMGATGTGMNSETGMTGGEAGTMGASPAE